MTKHSSKNLYQLTNSPIVDISRQNIFPYVTDVTKMIEHVTDCRVRTRTRVIRYTLKT